MKSRDGWALALAALLAVAGVAHFVTPGDFEAIVPRILPGTPTFWTSASGVAELALAIGIAVPATRRGAATLAVVFFVVVLPANIQMAVDWSTRAAPEFALALLRLPLQIPLIWWAWHVRQRARAPLRRECAHGGPLQ